eukprot:gene300-biopygen8985
MSNICAESYPKPPRLTQEKTVLSELALGRCAYRTAPAEQVDVDVWAIDKKCLIFELEPSVRMRLHQIPLKDLHRL